MAFSVLSLAMIGIPLGVRVGRKETYANVALALILAMTYYFLIIMVGWLENQPALRPDLLIWIPNLLFQTLGLWLIFKANKR
jgi:lipopolysaccharide export system permease protein